MRLPPSIHPALVGACVAAFSAVATAAEVRVAVAANFAGTLERIGTAFTAATGHTLRISSGATGRFAVQVAAGAPFELLLAADADTPARLVAQGHAVAGSAYTYALGRLALWSADPGLVDGEGRVLASTRWRHLAIANPRTAPYGAAALQVLAARGLDRQLAPRLVTGESIAQAWQFVHSGQAELGFVALSQLRVPGRPARGSTWIVPAGLHAPIRQDAVLLAAGRDQPAAQALLAWLKSASARAEMRAWGYDEPVP